MQIGELIAGKYRIDRILGQGGMGTVAAATNLAIDQRVALKFLLPELLSDAMVVERLLREARASAKLRSEHVCLVYDVGNHDGEPFIVMELLEGRDLASMVSTHVVLPVAVAADYMLQIATGLAEAHALGIVHRDLKPANLFLTRRLDGSPLIKVLDFGIAKAPTDKQFHLTRTAAVMGSPGYMSPEQLRSSRDADARSDIWALGVILFELTAGRPPFIAESITELALKVGMDPMPALPGVPRAFERVVARCLEKDPGRRFPDVGALATALAPFGTGRAAAMAETIVGMLQAAPARAVSTRPGTAHDAMTSSGGRPARSAAATTLGSSARARSTGPAARARLPWRMVIAAVLAASAGAGLVVLTQRHPDAPAEQSHNAATAGPHVVFTAPPMSALDAGTAMIELDAAAVHAVVPAPSAVPDAGAPDPKPAAAVVAAPSAALPGVPVRATSVTFTPIEPAPVAPTPRVTTPVAPTPVVTTPVVTSPVAPASVVTKPVAKPPSVKAKPAIAEPVRGVPASQASSPRPAAWDAEPTPSPPPPRTHTASPGSVAPKPAAAKPVAAKPVAAKPAAIKDIGASRE